MTATPEAPNRAWLRAVRAGVGVAAVGVLAVVVVTGTLLTWRYRPDGGAPGYSLGASARWSRRLVRQHQTALSLGVPAVALWGGLTIGQGWARVRPRRRAGLVTAATAPTVLTLVASFSWWLVKWDQLALASVTVGEDLTGLWVAGFSDRVRFVLVGDVEVSKTTIAIWVIVHLAAPVLALAGMVAAWRLSAPDSPERG